MFSTGPEVLLVDDDPDVLEVSKLAMRSFTVYGVPIRLITATSRAEATELLQTTLASEQGTTTLTVAFVDVVMETDDAGLELCRYVREEMNNKETQLFIRTGQPGVAPERSVIDRYNINGYYTKSEATVDKLYTLTKAGARQAQTLILNRVLGDLMSALIESDGRAQMAAILNHVIHAMVTDSTGRETDIGDARVGIAFDGQVVAKHQSLGDAEILDRVQSLDRLPATSFDGTGDKWVAHEGHFIVRVNATPKRAEMAYICPVPGTGEVPDHFPEPFYRWACGIAALWKRAA